MVKDASNITKPRKTMQQAIGFNFYDVFVVGFCVIFALICFYLSLIHILSISKPFSPAPAKAATPWACSTVLPWR